MTQEPTTLLLTEPPDFITSDTHLGHERILDYCPGRRGWGPGIRDLAAHDAWIISSWWGAVHPRQTVLHLGDFAFGSPEQIAAYRARLPGRVWLVAGNHDRSLSQMTRLGFEWVVRRCKFPLPGIGDVVCRHRPKDFTAEDAAEAVLLLHGHTHGDSSHHAADQLAPGVFEKLVDVGVDPMGATPWRLSDNAAATRARLMPTE